MTSRYTTALLRLSLAALVAAALPALGHAGTVVAFGGASGPGLASMSFNNLGTPSPANDDVAGASDNWIAVNQKDFSSVNYIDMLFIVSDSASATTTEYILTEGVNNGTGIPWTDYHIELGFGTGVDYLQSPPGDGLDFDAPDENSPYSFGPFTTLTIGEDTIDAVDGTVNPGEFYNFAFPIDVPDGITEFTVRQYPTTDPVPAELSTWGRIKNLY